MRARSEARKGNKKDVPFFVNSLISFLAFPVLGYTFLIAVFCMTWRSGTQKKERTRKTNNSLMQQNCSKFGFKSFLTIYITASRFASVRACLVVQFDIFISSRQKATAKFLHSPFFCLARRVSHKNVIYLSPRIMHRAVQTRSRASGAMKKLHLSAFIQRKEIMMLLWMDKRKCFTSSRLENCDLIFSELPFEIKDVFKHSREALRIVQ